MTDFRLCWHFRVMAHTLFLHFSFVPLLCEIGDLPPGWDFLKCHPSKPQLLPYLKTPPPSLPWPLVLSFPFLPLIFAQSPCIQRSSVCFYIVECQDDGVMSRRWGYVKTMGLCHDDGVMSWRWGYVRTMGLCQDDGVMSERWGYVRTINFRLR